MQVPDSNQLVCLSVHPSVCPFHFPHDILRRNGWVLMKLACDTWYISPSLKFDVQQIPCIFNEAAAIWLAECFPHDILRRNGEISMKLACDTWYISPSFKFDVRQIPCIFNEAAAI
jgi:hypothetical protein